MSAPSLLLEPTRPRDLAFVLAAERHPENAPFVGAWSQQRHLAAIESPDEAHFVLIPNRLDVAGPVGYTILQDLTSPHGALQIRRLVVTEKGQGYGRAALLQLQHFAFVTCQAHRLWLDVKTHNHRAQQLYRQVGFQPEGCLRECFKAETGYESLYLMSMLVQEYWAAQAAPPEA